jgi:hypothetical protein
MRLTGIEPTTNCISPEQKFTIYFSPRERMLKDRSEVYLGAFRNSCNARKLVCRNLTTDFYATKH